MASGPPGERLREEARCPVCLDFLQEPVSVDCGHSFCLRCISEFCEKSDSAQGGVYACPQCRGPFRPAGFRPNRQLAGLVESVRRLGLGAGPGARRCARHGEDLSRFCEEDQAALCWLCDAGPEHRTHRTAPLQEAAGRYQVKLQMALELVRKELEDTLTQEANVGRKTVIWKEKVEMQRQRFKLEFEKHRGFLAQEEQRQLRWLEAEERTTLQRLRESKNRLAQQSKALKELADELQERCQRPALGLLEGVRGVLNSKAVTRLEAENIPMELKTACCIPGRRELLRKFQGLFNHTRAHQVLFMMLLTTVLTSLFGNALMILLIHRERRLHTPMYFLLSQLSLMDVMLVFTTVPKMAADYLTGNKAISRAGCGVQIFFLLTTDGGECFLLAAMAYDRYAAVCHPLRYPTLMSWQLCLRMTMSCWFLGAADGLLQAVATLSFPYCGAHEIDHFFCEAPVLVSDELFSKLFSEWLFTLMLPLTMHTSSSCSKYRCFLHFSNSSECSRNSVCF
ncbi:E3 ubiquitin-protein ligase TRIM58 isoform X3 [Symphalangus syndactylus]|uniref:E3 ubiquitin-protein ligase TRIM58 isoform X3 n=1 Tax=Symphalangus syndactylus TaxID=9590 RepID=UPI003003C3F5